MEATDRQIQLIVYRSPLFPAHWSLFIPTESNPDFGKRIHAIGDPLHGFQLEFKRGYDLSATSSKKTVIDLCRVDGVHVVDGPAERGSDKIPIDDIEKKATEVPAPEGSMNPAGSTVGTY